MKICTTKYYGANKLWEARIIRNSEYVFSIRFCLGYIRYYIDILKKNK